MRHPFDLNADELATIAFSATDLDFSEELTTEAAAQVNGSLRYITTRAVGEEGGYGGTPAPKPRPVPHPRPSPYPIDPPEVTTLALGEEGGEWATTLAVGEEGGDVITTMAIGEEGGFPVK